MPGDQQNPTLGLVLVTPCMLCSCTVCMCSSPPGKINACLQCLPLPSTVCGNGMAGRTLSGLSSTRASASSFPKVAWHQKQGLWEQCDTVCEAFPLDYPSLRDVGGVEVWNRGMECQLSCSPPSPSFPSCKLAVPSLLKAWSQGVLALLAVASSVATPHWRTAGRKSSSGEVLVRFKG